VRDLRRREPRVTACLTADREAIVVRFGEVVTAFDRASFRLRAA
jgi:hypothetical protein